MKRTLNIALVLLSIFSFFIAILIHFNSSVLEKYDNTQEKFEKIIENTENSNPLQVVTSYDHIEYYSNAPSSSSFAVVQEGSGYSLYGWGLNGNGELGMSTSPKVYVPTKIAYPWSPSANIQKITTNRNATMVLLDNNEIWSAGVNNKGQLGDGTNISRAEFKKIQALNNIGTINDMKSGWDFTAVVVNNNQLWMWGRNNDYQINGTDGDKFSPIKVLDKEILRFEIGLGNTYVLVKETINGIEETNWYGWGKPLALGINLTINSKKQEKLSFIPATANVLAGETNAFYYEGSVLKAWGDNSKGQLGLGDINNRPTPATVDLATLGVTNITNMYHTHNSIYLVAGNKIYSTGENLNGELGLGKDPITEAFVDTFQEIKEITLSANYRLFVKRQGISVIDEDRWWAWGNNLAGNEGQFGIGPDYFNIYTKPLLIDPFNPTPSKLVSNLNNTGFAKNALDSFYTNGQLVLDNLKTYVNGFDEFPSDTKFTLNGTPTINNDEGWIKIIINADRYYASPNGNKFYGSANFSVEIIGFNKSSAITNRAVYLGNAAETTPTLLNNTLKIASPNQLQNLLDPYLEFNFTEQYSGVTPIITGYAYDAVNSSDKLGKLSFTLSLNDYHENGVTVKQKTISLLNLIKTSTITVKPVFAETAIKRTVLAVRNDFDAAQTIADKISIITPYLNIDLPTQIVPNTTASITSLSINTATTDNAKGILGLTLQLKDYYEPLGSKDTLDFLIVGFIKDSKISLYDDYSDAAKITSVLGLTKEINKASTHAEYLDLLTPFLNIEFTTQTAPNTDSVIIAVDVLDDQTNAALGQIALNLTLKDYYENGVLVTTKKFILINLLNNPNFAFNIKSIYNTAISPVALANRMLNETRDKIIVSELQEYFDISGVTYANDSLNVQAFKVNPNNDGSLEFTLNADRWFEYGYLHTTPKIFTIKIENLIKDSSLQIKADYSDIANNTSVQALEFAIASANSDLSYQNVLAAYFDIVFTNQTTPNANASINHVIVDQANTSRVDGKITLTIFMNNYYEEGIQIPNLNFELSGFKNSPHFEIVTKPYATNKNAQEVLDYLLNGSTTQIDLQRLLEYTDLTNGIPNDAIISLASSIVNPNNDGTLTLNLVTNKWYEYGYLNNTDKAFSVSLNGFIKNSKIDVKTDYSAVVSNISVQDFINTVNNSSVSNYQNILSPFFDIEFTPQTAPNQTASIIDLQIHESPTSAAAGKINITIHLDNYFVNNVKISPLDFELSGFKNSPHFEIVTKPYATNKNAQEVLDYLLNGSTTQIDLQKLLEYTDLTNGIPNDAIISLVSNTVNPNNDGTLTLNLVTNKWYEYGYLNNTDKTFSVSLNGFIKNSMISARSGPYSLSPQAAFNSFATAEGTVFDREQLNQYIDLSHLDPNVEITRILPQFDNVDGILQLELQVTNYYINNSLQATIPITITNFIPDSQIFEKPGIVKIIPVQLIYDNLFNDDGSYDESVLTQYVSLDFDSSLTKITKLNVDLEPALGEITFIFELEHFYVDGVAQNQQSLRISGFKNTPTSNIESRPDVYYYLSAKEAFAQLVNQDNTIDKTYLALCTINLDTFPASATLRLGTVDPVVDNKTGTLRFDIIADQVYEFGYLVHKEKTFSLFIEEFIKDSDITLKPDVQLVTAQQAALEINAAQQTGQTAFEAILNKYFDFNLALLTVVDWTQINITTVNTAQGSLTMLFNNLQNFYRDGEIVNSLSLEINGFVVNSTVVENQTQIDTSLTAGGFLESITTTAGQVDLTKLMPYLHLKDLPNDANISIVDSEIEVFGQEGKISIVLRVDRYFEQGELVSGNKDFTITLAGFRISFETINNFPWWALLLSIIGFTSIIILIYIALLKKQNQYKLAFNRLKNRSRLV